MREMESSQAAVPGDDETFAVPVDRPNRKWLVAAAVAATVIWWLTRS